MFGNLQDRLTKSLDEIAGVARLDEDNIKGTLREVRMALLEADVALPVVKDFVDRVKEKALGEDVKQSLNPGQTFLKLVESELKATMGEANESLDLSTTPPAVILMAGLQGAGKTTTTGKLAKLLKERDKKKVLVVSADVYRPAAIMQLQTLANDLDVEFFPSDLTQKPVVIAQQAVAHAKRHFIDVVIVDTAGRMQVDQDMMDEIANIHSAVKPVETLFVVDAMTGQDAANTAKAFGEVLPLTGVILTKADADARGGAALSVRHITGKPIKFLGVGEKTDALEPFHPDRIASRILGMGDVLSLIEEAEQKLDQKKAKKMAKKILKGKGFDLEDFKEQIHQMRSMGGISGMLDKLPNIPGMGNVSQMAAQANVDMKQFDRMEAIINSMTLAERRNPDLLNGSRKRRITVGSGTTIQDLNRLIKQHKQMSKMMKKVGKKGGMKNMMRGMGGMMSGGMPPGGMGGGGMPPGGLPPGFK